MCDRDKLMKLCDTKIENMHFVNSDHWFDFSQKIEELVDYLISNGVTVTNVGCKSEWISVEERLPEENGYYLVYTKYGYIEVERYKTWDDDDLDGGYWWEFEGCVTHWMPLPEAPKGGAE